MIYVAALREIWNRLNYHNKPAGILTDLKIKPNGEYRIEGEDALPQLSMVDLGIQDGVGTSEGRMTLFLRTSRSNGWVSMSPGDPLGLYDWAEMVMDAVETSPSSGKSDTYLLLHKANGSPIMKGGQQVQLLTEQLTWDVRMSEINDLSFLLELDVIFKAPTGRRSNRREAPVTNSDY